MSRQYSNRYHDHTPSDNSSRRFRQSSQNDFSYFQYPPHREINNNNHHPLSRITAAATTSASTPHYRFENPSAASFTRHPPWFDDDDHNRTTSRSSHHNNHTKRQRSSATTTTTSNSQLNHHQERKRSRHDENERNRHYQPYPNHRSIQIQQPTNPTSHNIPRFSRSFDNESHNRPVQSSPIPSSYRQSMSSTNTSHRNGMTFEPTSYHPPLFHQTSMSTHIHPRPSPSFLLTNLLHRIIDAHAASYSDNYVHYHPASIDLIAYTWMSPSHEIFSLPTAFSIQFSDFFDLIIPDETPVVGLTVNELERLPTMIYSKTDMNIKVDDKCAVCLSEYINGEKLKRLRCKHYFHSECIDPWLKTSTRCPICRGEQTS